MIDLNRPAPEESGAEENDAAPGLENSQKFKQMNNNEKSIVKYIYLRGKAHIDEIIRELDMPAREVGTILSLLAIKGMVGQSAGNIYSIKDL